MALFIGSAVVFGVILFVLIKAFSGMGRPYRHHCEFERPEDWDRSGWVSHGH